MLRIFAWNPNGIRALLRNNEKDNEETRGHLEAFMREQRPDIVFFPETKGSEKARYECQTKLDAVFKRACPNRKWKWYWSFCNRAGRHGNVVAVSTAINVEEVSYNLDAGGAAEEEGRIIGLRIDAEAVEGRGVYILGLYVPNASTGLSRLQHKVEWLKRLRRRMDGLRRDGNTVVVLGDINVAPDERDICNPKPNVKKPGYTKEERNTFAWMMAEADDEDVDDIRTGAGYVDVWRELNELPKQSQAHAGVYTFWNTRSRARSRNAGWRIDLVLLDQESFDAGVVNDVMICQQYHGSDHCPIGVEIKLNKC